MRIIYKIYFYLISIFIYLKGLGIKDSFLGYSTPIVINNYNRLEYLLMLISFLEKSGYTNIIILDNNSNLPSLVEYYKVCKHRVYRLDKNIGFKALEKCNLYDEIKDKYFVLTDSDVVPLDICPKKFIFYFYQILKKYPTVQKVGFSLKIDDIPEYYNKKNEVITWESNFYKNEIRKGLFLSPIDTTFALHRPFSKISTNGFYKHIRTDHPYIARHLPWYEDSSNLSPESLFYKNNATIGGHWTNGKIG